MEEFFRIHGSTVVVAASTFVALQLVTNLFRKGPSAMSPTKIDHKVGLWRINQSISIVSMNLILCIHTCTYTGPATTSLGSIAGYELRSHYGIRDLRILRRV